MEEDKVTLTEQTEQAQPAEQKERCLSRAVVGYWHYGVILTYMALLFAVTGILFSARGKAGVAVVCLLLSGLCDAFDGVVARTRKNRSSGDKSFGIQIDSLADLVSFGVAPVLIGFAMGMNEWYYVVLFCAYVLSALVRLAYYNVTEEQRTQSDPMSRRKSFEGLPVTVVSLSLPVFYLIATMFRNVSVGHLIMLSPFVLGTVLMVVRVPVPKLRPKHNGILIALMAVLIISLFLIRWFVVGVHRL